SENWCCCAGCLGSGDERTSRSPRNPAAARGRHADRDRPAAAAGCAEDGVLAAELVRRLVPEPRSERRNDEDGAAGPDAGAVVRLRKEVPVRDEHTAGEA